MLVFVYRESSYVSSSPVRTDRSLYGNTTSPHRFPPFSPTTTVLGAPSHGDALRCTNVSSYSGPSCGATARTYGGHCHRHRNPSFSSPSLAAAAAQRPCIAAVGLHGTYPSSPAKINRSYYFF